MVEADILDFPDDPNIRWFNDVNKVKELADWLDKKNRFKKPSDVVAYFRRPWEWIAEYYEMKEEKERG